MGEYTEKIEKESLSGPNKRKRSSVTSQKISAPQARELCDQSNVAATSPTLASTLGLSSRDDSTTLDALVTSNQIQIHSVLSSSKIQKKVASILRHISSADGNGDGGESEPQSCSRGRVSILHARAPDAAKLITIAEIVKRELAKPWYQYIALGEEIRETPRGGKDGPSIVEDTVLCQRSADEKPARQTGNPGAPTDGDDEDDFEIMKTRLERAVEGRPLVRGIPVMTLFLSLAPVEVLRKKYGEQSDEGRPC